MTKVLKEQHGQSTKVETQMNETPMFVAACAGSAARHVQHMQKFSGEKPIVSAAQCTMNELISLWSGVCQLKCIKRS